MIGSLSRVFDNVFGRGDAAVTVPPLDGTMRPNRALDEAEWRSPLADVDCLAVQAGVVVASAGQSLHTLGADGRWSPRKKLGGSIACIAALGPDALAVAKEDGEITIEGGAFDGRHYRADGTARCITAMAAGDGGLFIANGSATNAAGDWQKDLLERNASGSVWRIDLANGESRRIAGGLAWPAGLALDGQSLVVSEAWKHRLVRISGRGQTEPVQVDLPGYPGRLSHRTGGWWMAMFAPRSQLIEFVLREPAYRKRMMAEVPPDYWIAPKLKSGRSYYEPLQGGGVKHLGLLKPWAPTMSFGMCVGLDPAFKPRLSLQSRADGNTHGITSVIEHDGMSFAAARGDGLVVRFSPPAQPSAAGGSA
ncbi:MAG: hypothetical protein M9939_06020 [Mesorhizobium sp.]|nr:hypothetical protein [Mesorhizobium sp.]MCO5160672.1 hypothetical protein [Mesorhizobium sp.]